MAKKPVAWCKVYDAAGNYRASFVECSEAAILCAALGTGSEARNGHAKKNAIWREGFEEQAAGESYDFSGSVMWSRVTADALPAAQPKEQS